MLLGVEGARWVAELLKGTSRGGVSQDGWLSSLWVPQGVGSAKMGSQTLTGALPCHHKHICSAWEGYVEGEGQVDRLIWVATPVER